MPGKMIDWPMVHEYDEALLNRRFSFRDSDIQNGNLTEIHPGLPMHLNGGGSQHICVYRVDNWVVRCFVSDPPSKIEPPADIIERYEKITAYIRQQQRAGHLKFLAPCDLVVPGVNIKGQYFPYLKIPYMGNSRSLGDFLSEYYHDHQTTALIAQKWREIIQEMEDHRLAHGDLDLSNVLVYGGYPSLGFYLIDFDGMYIPDFAFTNMDVTDRGHAHFQPSLPSIRRFDSTMDHFSVLVIYLSLCALEQNPDLWEKCEASERNMLLQEEDFQRLAQSARFSLLRKEQHNRRLQLCLDELQKSIDQKKMPRSLKEILKETGSISAEDPYVVYQPVASGPYEGMPLIIPIDEPVTVDSQYSYTPSTPLPVYPSPSVSSNIGRATSPSRSSQVNWGWIIAVAIVVIVLVIFIFSRLGH